MTIEKGFNLKLPNWTDEVYPDKLLALAERNLAVLTENDFMKRVKGGNLTILNSNCYLMELLIIFNYYS